MPNHLGTKIKHESAVKPKAVEVAMHLTSVDRNNIYGDPKDNFATTAAMWNAYIERRRATHERDQSQEYVFELEARDVAFMMCLVKIARLSNTPDHHDSLVDLIGYAITAEMCGDA